MPKTIALLCAALLLSACGQTGPLYLPEQGAPKHQAKRPPIKVVPAAESAPEAPSPPPAAAPAAPSAPDQPDEPDAAPRR
ncbi:LPS translocon maturation chaperone LptM [Solimonas flava]|uniref:LPS translocon maturation chaperone LptM n=1 Tax=Solimonas flava TaxID=415849 RepID=UPI0004874723|nr:lipoprotein [Solimonas flava]